MEEYSVTEVGFINKLIKKDVGSKGGQALPTLSPHRGKAGDYLLSHTLWHFCVLCGWVSGNGSQVILP